MARVLALVLLFSFSVAWAADDAEIIGPRKLNLCSLIIGDFTPEEAVTLPFRPINEGAAALEKRLLSDMAAAGLRRLIEADHGVKILALLERLGLLTEEKWVELHLLANQTAPLVLDERQPDPRIKRYLKSYRRQARKGNIENVISVPGWDRRHDLFFALTLEAFSVFIDPLSVNALETTFAEIHRLYLAVHVERTRTLESIESQVERLLRSLDTKAWYHPKPRTGLPALVRVPLEQIPFVPIVFTAFATFYKFVFERDLPSEREPYAPKLAPRSLVEAPGSRRLFIVDRDPLSLGGKAYEFLNRYLNTQAGLFEPSFVAALGEAYPALNLVLKSAISNRFAAKTADVIEGPFGPVSFEGQKALTRDALFLSLLRGDYEPFKQTSAPVPVEQIERYRQLLIWDLGFSKNSQAAPSELNYPMVDAFQVFLMLDALGRGQDAFTSALRERYDLNRLFETDYERLLVELLTRYPHADQSFQRLDPKHQELVRRCFKLVYHFNAGQVIQLESGHNAFAKLAELGATQQELSFIFHRTYLSFLSLPINGDTPPAGTARMTPFFYERWMQLRLSLFNLDLHSYLDWYAQQLGLSEAPKDPRGFTILSLAGQSRSENARAYAEVEHAFNKLPPKTAAVVVKLMTQPILPYFSADLMQAIRLRHPPGERDLIIWMNTLANIYNAIESQPNFPSYLEQVLKAGEIRVNLLPVKEFVRAHGSAALEDATFFVLTKQGAYEIEVRK
ncbi:hypothetical protein K2X33_14200 [bacterium]|nr:hypothetical protein [bacterium]